jgi:hypothetical protein
MRIELTWPRAGAADRTLTVAIPDAPVAGLIGPATRQVRRLAGLCSPGALRGVIACVEPVVGSAAGAVGAGVLVQLALPYAVRIARQSRREASPCESGLHT